MPSREGPYELTSDFRSAKRDLHQELQDDLQRNLDYINRNFPSGHSQQAVSIEDACCGHLSRTDRKYRQELLEPAPLTHQRRSELFRGAIDEAFHEIGALARKGGVYDAVEMFRDEILRRDQVRLEIGEAEDAIKLIDSQPDLRNARSSVEGQDARGQRPGDAEKLANDTRAAKPIAADWEDIELTFIGDHDVQIRVGGGVQTLNYKQIEGFANRKDGKPTLQWEMLKIFGRAPDDLMSEHARHGKEWEAIRKTIERTTKPFGSTWPQSASR